MADILSLIYCDRVIRESELLTLNPWIGGISNGTVLRKKPMVLSKTTSSRNEIGVPMVMSVCCAVACSESSVARYGMTAISTASATDNPNARHAPYGVERKKITNSVFEIY